MKKFVSFLFLLTLALSATAFSQGWSFQGYFPDSTFQGSYNKSFGTGVHAIAVAPDGNVWFGYINATDSILSGTNTYSAVRDIFVYKPDGTPASFSPIKIISGNGITDTMYNSTRGARADQNGNILWSSYNILYRVNYQTGAGMNKAVYSGGTLTAPAVDTVGDIFVAPVIPNHPIQIWNTDFTLQGTNVQDSSVGFSRTLEVSKDGNTVYWCGYTNNSIWVYHRTDAFSPYVLTDTVLKGLSCESIAWDPKTGYLWCGSGNAQNNPPNQYPGVSTSYTPSAWYAVDTKTWAIKDSILWHFHNLADDARPRGMAFSPDGNTVYVVGYNFNQATFYPSIEKFSRPLVGIKEQGNSNIVTSFTLSQNYPNPFNPSTEITFSVAKSGLVTLKVYDLLGRLVSTLVNENKSTGNYTVRFDASRLASGTYIYQMNANGVLLTKKMVLLK
ncbi:MAG: T9SS type A sorting domain-containing protein [Ignavibacteriaceae bacterium]